MRLIDTVILSGAKIIRHSPPFKGLGRIARAYNNKIISVLSEPIVQSKMKDGTTIIVDLRSHTESDAYYRGEYDRDLLSTIFSIIDPNAVFLDVGANIGFYTIALSNFFRKHNTSGYVISFEPLSSNYVRLAANIKNNSLENWCSIYNIGLSSISKTENLILREDFLRGSMTGNASVETNENFDRGFIKIPIKLDRLDIFWKEEIDLSMRIDFMKIDIEGHEDFCLKGGQETISLHRPTILMEVNKPYYQARGVELNKLFVGLIPKDYIIYKKFNRTWQAIVNLDLCNTVDNVILIPTEKINLKSYKEVFA